MTLPKITTLTPWFGSNRMLAEKAGELLNGKEWVGVPFAGGMSELLYITARTLVVNDLHRLQINLARIVASALYGPPLYRRLRRKTFHPDEQAESRQVAQTLAGNAELWEHTRPNLDAAEAYFVATWMNRSAKAGTKQEFGGGLPLRWEAGGGDSAVRYFNAADSLRDWRKVLRRANFSTLDAFEFLAKCREQDKKAHGIYCDPPFFGPGDAYRHTFTEQQHRDLSAKLLCDYQHTRVVCRFYDVPLIRELYPDEHWNWVFLEGRKQTNAKAAEVLIYRN